MKTIEMPSGAKLEITLAPFSDANVLYKKIARELKTVKVNAGMDIENMDVNFIKDLMLTAIGSDEIEDAIKTCMKRCTYKGVKIDKDTFEPEEARGDYFQVCFEIAKENLLPFLKGLFAQLKDILPKKNVPLV